jgi:hypothetical protein
VGQKHDLSPSSAAGARAQGGLSAASGQRGGDVQGAIQVRLSSLRWQTIGVASAQGLTLGRLDDLRIPQRPTARRRSPPEDLQGDGRGVEITSSRARLSLSSIRSQCENQGELSRTTRPLAGAVHEVKPEEDTQLAFEPRPRERASSRRSSGSPTTAISSPPIATR